MAKSRKTDAQNEEREQRQISQALKREYKPVPRFGGGCPNC